MKIYSVFLGPVTLHYRPAKLDLRWLDRSERRAWEPVIDLSDYRVNAVVDWVQFQLTLPKPSQFRYVQDCLKAATAVTHYVEPKGVSKRSCRLFAVKIQDPRSRHIEAMMVALEARWPGIIAKVDAMEVSVDFYPHDQSDEKRLLMVSVLQRHFAPDRTVIASRYGRPRQANGVKMAPEKLFHRGGFSPIDGFNNLSFGPRSGPVLWRVQNKTTDKWLEEGPTELDQSGCRARIEVMLEGTKIEQLGLSSPRDLADFSFERLKSYFPFKLPTLPKQRAHGTTWDGVADYWWQRAVLLLRENGVWAMETANAYGAAALQTKGRGKRKGKGKGRAILPLRVSHAAPLPRYKSKAITLWPTHLRRPPKSPSLLTAYPSLNERVRQALRNLSF